MDDARAALAKALDDNADVDELYELAGLRFAVGVNALIYDTKGTSSQADDVAIMELRNFRTTLTLSSFEIVAASAHKTRIVADYGIDAGRAIPDGFRVNPLTSITSVAVDEHEFADTASAQKLASLDIDALGVETFLEIESVDGATDGITDLNCAAKIYG